MELIKEIERVEFDNIEALGSQLLFSYQIFRQYTAINTLNYTHNIISEALDPKFFTDPGYPLDYKNKPVRDFAMLESLEPSVLYQLNEELDVKNKDGGRRFNNFTKRCHTKPSCTDEGKSVFPSLSYQMMGYIGEMADQGKGTAKAVLTPRLKEWTQKTIMFDPFYEKALNQRAGILGDINISRVFVLYNETMKIGTGTAGQETETFSVVTLPAQDTTG